MDLRATLQRLGIDREGHQVVSLLPLVRVAWADGAIHEAERTEIMAVATSMGWLAGNAREVLDRWLTTQPTSDVYRIGLALLDHLTDYQHDRIHLRALTGTEVDQLVACWDDNGTLLKDVVGRLPHEHPFFESLRANNNAAPLRSIFRSARLRWGAVVLREAPYMDAEYWESHVDLYARAFLPRVASCVRYHFFSRPNAQTPKDYDEAFADALVDAFTDGADWGEVQERVGGASYVGYTVVRPIAAHVVSRTAIRFDERPATEIVHTAVPLSPGEDGLGTAALRIAQTCRVHLCNATLDLEAPEFIQQDPNMSTCASASLWVASRKIGGRHRGATNYPLSMITRQSVGGTASVSVAGSVYDPTETESGLSTDQVRLAIAQTGWQSVRMQINKQVDYEREQDRLRTGLFVYLDSGFPVIAALDDEPLIGHAVAPVGYRAPASDSECTITSAIDELHPRPNDGDLPKTALQQHHLWSSGVNLFFAHDDQYGPYNRITFVTESRRPFFVLPKKTEAYVLRGRAPTKCFTIGQVLAAVPPEVRQGYETPLRRAIIDADAFLGATLERYSDLRCLWRVVLVDSAEYKGTASGYPADLRARYAQLHMPKYLWLCELTVMKVPTKPGAGSLPETRVVNGEFLFDATCPYYELNRLCWRISNTYAEGEQPPTQLEDSVPPLPAFVPRRS